MCHQIHRPPGSAHRGSWRSTEREAPSGPVHPRARKNLDGPEFGSSQIKIGGLVLEKCQRGCLLPRETDFSHIDDPKCGLHRCAHSNIRGTEANVALSVPQMRLRRGHSALSLLVGPSSGNRANMLRL
jgi:hypothetical protein